MYSYDNLLNFMTVKGANHHVTFSKPSEALFIFTNIVLNQSQWVSRSQQGLDVSYSFLLPTKGKGKRKTSW